MPSSRHYNIGPVEVWRYQPNSREPRFRFERWQWSDGRWINKPRLHLGGYTYCAAWWSKF